MINSRDISVVVQGAIDEKITPKCLKSIRKYLPKAEIILSTWEGSDINGLDYDILVLNQDPGALPYDDFEHKPNNINRILVSSKNGLAKAARKYILRIRSDVILKNTAILNLTDDFAIRNPDSSLFKQRIFAYELFSIKYDIKNKIKQRMLFHVSDWCYFGLNEDIQELFNVPLVKEPDFSEYFKIRKKPVSDIHERRYWKMSPEAHITSVNASKIFKDLKFDDYLDVTEENIRISEDFIINNFRILSQKQFGISPLKKLYKHTKMFVLYNPLTYYSEIEQLKDYNKYCDLSAQFPQIGFVRKLYKIKYYEPLRKHFLLLIYSHPLKKPSELISTIFYLVKFILSILSSLKSIKDNY